MLNPKPAALLLARLRSITFGGGGIYGACKDISIAEVAGCVTIVGEPGGVDEAGAPRPARLVLQFEAQSGGGSRCARG